MKFQAQDLQKLLDFHGHDSFPRISQQLDPVRSKGELLIPFFARDDSRYLLALKSAALPSTRPELNAMTQDLIGRFRRMSREDQEFVAQNLSHELKIASFAACLALKNQSSSVYEIGPGYGFSSFQYSHLMKEKNIDSSRPIGKLIALEQSRDCFDGAQSLKKMIGQWIGDIEIVLGDAIGYLRNSLRNGDIVFCSLAEPAVALGILDLSRVKPLNLIVSYSARTEDKIALVRGKKFEDLLDPQVYDVYPFKDKKYNSEVRGDLKRIGLLSLISGNVEMVQTNG